MKRSDIRMGMPVRIEIVDNSAQKKDIDAVLDYFEDIDNRFSPYKLTSELERYNRQEIARESLSEEMKKILTFSEQTKRETRGYFNIQRKDTIDPSGIVKGYAISEAAKMLKRKGYKNFFVEIAGDIQTQGVNYDKKAWRIGIKNPFNPKEIVKVVVLTGEGVATSGTYARGNHLYNPIGGTPADEIMSMTVFAGEVFDADRMATAAFAMGVNGIQFIESLPGYEGYMITKEKEGIWTSGFARYTV